MSEARTVVLLRHAEAEPEGAAGDRARRLTRHGKAQAHGIGAALRSHGLLPGLVLASPAARAAQTAELAAEAAGLRLPVQHDGTLYEADVDAVLASLARAKGTVWLVGHNPSLERTCILLAGLPRDWRLGKGRAAVLALDAWPPRPGAARLLHLLEP